MLSTLMEQQLHDLQRAGATPIGLHFAQVNRRRVSVEVSHTAYRYAQPPLSSDRSPANPRHPESAPNLRLPRVQDLPADPIPVGYLKLRQPQELIATSQSGSLTTLQVTPEDRDSPVWSLLTEDSHYPDPQLPATSPRNSAHFSANSHRTH